MARVSIERPRYGYHDDTVVEFTLNLIELGELARIVKAAQAASILPVPAWVTDLVRLAQ